MELIDVYNVEKELSSAVEKATCKGVIIIEGINKDKCAKEFWTKVKEDDRIGVTFDCYYFGICFLDKEMYKQHYKLNFFDKKCNNVCRIRIIIVFLRANTANRIKQHYQT